MSEDTGNMCASNSDQQYVISRAKDLLSVDRHAAKAWMLTAKTLFPNDFAVQFEAYKIQKSLLDPNEAAKSFSEVYQKFSTNDQILEEIDNMIYSLRYLTGEIMNEFNRNMFSLIRPEIQKEILICAVHRTPNVMECCRVVLILLEKFPDLANKYLPGLVDKLLLEEKQQNIPTPLNCYRKMLVCEIVQLMAHPTIDLAPKLLFRIMNKTLEFCLCYVTSPVKDIQDPTETDNNKILDPWNCVIHAQALLSEKLKWELGITYSSPWGIPFLENGPLSVSKQQYWQNIVKFNATQKSLPEEQRNYKQLLYCTAVFFLRCLYEYVSCVEASHVAAGNIPLVLIEGFVEPVINVDPNRKLEPEDALLPELTYVSLPGLASLKSNFLLCVSCWDVLHDMPVIQKEFSKLTQMLNVEPMMKIFLHDVALYRRSFGETLSQLQAVCVNPLEEIRRQLRLASINLVKNDVLTSVEHILNVADLISVPNGEIEIVRNTVCISTERKCHLHFLPLSRPYILLYCVKFLMKALEKKIFPTEIIVPGMDVDLATGHLLTLSQYDWPAEENLALKIFDKIRQQKCFTYKLFCNYIINPDFLEEFMYLTTDKGGKISLDIFGPPSTNSQRRVTTRGADKVGKEDLKAAMKKQMGRSRELPEVVVTKFLVAEKQSILHSFVPLLSPPC